MRVPILTDLWRPATAILIIVGLVAASCDDSEFAPLPDDMLALGTWGGDNVAVMVTEERTHVHVGCTFGDMPAEVPLDDEGRFAIDGNYVLRAYPIQLGPSLPAQFSGVVSGRTLTLAIAVNDTVEKKVVALGPVSVVFGREPQMGSCPICSLGSEVRGSKSERP
jgi:hypothetical protein